MRKGTGSLAMKWVLILLLGFSVAACGGRKRTTTTVTTVTTTPATASGVAGVSESGFTADPSGQASGTGIGAGDIAQAGTSAAGTAVDAAESASNAEFRTRGKLLLAGVGSAIAVEGATGSSGFGVPADSGAQCSNPFGGAAALGGQSICADTGERLLCQCTDDGCQLFRTGVQACSPLGAVVN